MINFEIFLLYRNRPDLVKEQLDALNSLSVPDNICLRIIISDNSKIPNTIIHNHGFEERYRNNINVQEHMNICIKEAQASRFMLIHDDDIICPDILKKVNHYISDPKYDSFTIAGRSLIFKGSPKVTNQRFGHFTTELTPKLERFLLELFYFKRNNYPALPCYIYHINNKAILHSDETRGGRFSDVTMLMPLYSTAKVVWVPIDIYYYRLHENNDGHVPDLKSMISLFSSILQSRFNLYVKFLVLFGLGKSLILKFLKIKLDV